MSIRTETADGVLTLTFDRLDRKNAITAAMYQTLADALVAAAGLPGSGHLGLACDVTRKADCEAAVAEALQAFGHIDVLV